MSGETNIALFVGTMSFIYLAISFLTILGAYIDSETRNEFGELPAKFSLKTTIYGILFSTIIAFIICGSVYMFNN